MAQFGRAPALGAGCRRFESCHPDHVVADYVSFATTFLLKSHRLTHAVSPPFRKKSRLLRLFACKRPHNASEALPTFCGFESISKLFAGIFFAACWQVESLDAQVAFGAFSLLRFCARVYSGYIFRKCFPYRNGFLLVLIFYFIKNQSPVPFLLFCKKSRCACAARL